MKQYILVKWEYGIVHNKIVNTWEDVEMFNSFSQAHEAMVASVAEKLNLLSDVELSHVHVSKLWASLTADIDALEKFFLKLRIFEKEV